MYKVKYNFNKFIIYINVISMYIKFYKKYMCNIFMINYRYFDIYCL